MNNKNPYGIFIYVFLKMQNLNINQKFLKT